MYHDYQHRQTHSPKNAYSLIPDPASFHTMSTRTLPYLLTTEHGMPMGQLEIKGSGLRFTQTIADGLRAGGLWLVMQDKCGTAAMNKGDIMMLAHIDAVDWLSERQITLSLSIQAEGMLHHDVTDACTTHLQGEAIASWSQQSPRTQKSHGPQKLQRADTSQGAQESRVSPQPYVDKHDVLVTRLQQSWQAQGRLLPEGHQDTDMAYRPDWICWRWLEILPISLATKQRLLKHPSPRICMRYIKKIIRHSDLSVQPLR